MYNSGPKTTEAKFCASAPGYGAGGKTGMMVVAGSGVVMAVREIL